MFVDRQGSGPAVVLVHGLGAYSFSWRDTVAVLSAHYTTYAVDLLGFGQSPAPAPFAYTIEAQADAVADLIDKQRLSNPVIIGHSMGGGVCLELAERASRPGAPSLSKMILIAPFTSMPERFRGMTGASPAAARPPAADAPLLGRKLVERVLHDAYASPSAVTTAQIDGYAKGMSTPDQIEAFYAHLGNLRDVSFPALSRIDTKTLIIWGENDRIVEAESVNKLKQTLRSVKLKQVDNCGHIPHEEMTAKTNALITDFLNE